MEGVIAPAFARAVEAGRSRYNTLFVQARRTRVALDGDEFLCHLRRAVNPVVAAVDTVAPDRVPAVVDALYELSLELVRKAVLGARARSVEVDRLWPGLLQSVAVHLAAQPRRVAAALTNGLYNLATTPGCRAEAWCDAVTALAPLCPEPELLLRAAQVAGWRCGLAHFREAALALAGELPAPVTRAALGADATPSEIPQLLQRLQADPWFPPAGPQPARGLRQVAVVGGFRGFGGVFLRPPRVAYHQGHFFAFDGIECWLVTADACGAAFHRAGAALPADESDVTFAIDASGTVTARRAKQKFAHLKDSTSRACNKNTLAVTLPHSHALCLIAGEA
jgi:hypothetical protein